MNLEEALAWADSVAPNSGHAAVTLAAEVRRLQQASNTQVSPTSALPSNPFCDAYEQTDNFERVFKCQN